MPVFSPISIHAIDQEEFGKIDYEVMRHAFDSQNELGRLCDEIIYQNDLAARLAAAGVGRIRTEVPVAVSHSTFAKTYFLDLVVDDAAIYELKTATSLIGDHDNQLLNYLFLRDVHHGKLVNFRPAQVEARFINTNLTPVLRRNLQFDARRWREENELSKGLRAAMIALLEDWGGFLDLALCTEAVVHLLGGEVRLLQLVPLARAGVRLGSQHFHLLDAETAFRLTAIPGDTSVHERQLQSLLRLTPLPRFQWINLCRHTVQFITLTRDD